MKINIGFFSHSSPQILWELWSPTNSPKEHQRNLLLKQSKSKSVTYLLQWGRTPTWSRLASISEGTFQDRLFSPGWCGSVDWAPACKPKGYWFDSQSGHMPGLQARSPVGGMREATSQCLSLSFSLPSPLMKNNKKHFFFLSEQNRHRSSQASNDPQS